MTPRKKKAVAATAPSPQPRRSTRQATKNSKSTTSNGIPHVYHEMLVNAAATQPDEFATSPRPSKRRKVSFEQTADVDELFESPLPPPPPLSPNPDKEDIEALFPLSVRPQQVVYDDFQGLSEESDLEFEDVELESTAQAIPEDEPVREKPLQIDLSKSALETPKRVVQRRKPVSKAERLMRLDVHKWHLLSLIGHGLHRNDWCNNEEVHSILKPLVPRKTIKLLHVDESKPQYERNYSFNKGVEEMCNLWNDKWTTTVQGLRKACWREGVDASIEADEGEDLDFDDFKHAARTCRGSRDLGAQLFTALLRSIAIEARLVFSLQVLPFTGAAKVETPVKPKPKPDYVYAPAQNYGASAIDNSPFVQPQTRLKKPKKIVDSSFPIFWTEILTPNQTWTPLDPVVRKTISKPKTQFEPPLSDNLNSMTYVVAYEEDNSAYDVTRRYTQWFNAKTRKLRVESTKNGEQWYASALSPLRKKLFQPRDEIEADELAKRVNSEGMPHNVQDFKNHPVYVLERHMRANEVLQPKREVGKVNVGTAKNGKIEPVYRRQDVHLCRTSDAWYRRGRDVKVGEQPLKVVVPKSQRNIRGQSAEVSDDENEQDRDGVGLYAEFQTSIYEPPPVIDGQIPKNAYGNLDVYVPSMIPPGAVHISHTLAAAAARLIGIDFADAVTGFEFKGRQGTAIVNGVVVAEKFTAAMAAVIEGLETLGSQEAQEARSRILLSVWKRMLQALRIRERVEAEYGPAKDNRSGSEHTDEDEDVHDPAYIDERSEDNAGGGFMLEDEATEEKVQQQAVNIQIMKAKMPAVLPDEVINVPIKITRSPHTLPAQESSPVRFIAPENRDNDYLFEDPDDANATGGGFIHEGIDEAESGGGFMIEDTNMEAGGFMPEDNNEAGGFILEISPTIPNQLSSASPNANLRTNQQSKLSSHNTTTNTRTKPRSTQNTSVDSSSLQSSLGEDTALQFAIAESLTAQTSINPPSASHEDPDSETKPTDASSSSAKDMGPIPAPSAPDPDRDADVDSPSSLLSHDPNDDDEEEPEWLNEALDE